VRYIDTGSRDPKHALGSWLDDILMGTIPVVGVRLQSGFFGSESLGYFEPTFQSLAQSNGVTAILVGSNDGQTPRRAVADLLTLVGAPRSGLKAGVVSFQTGFFHPKVFHFQRADGSSAAYVGSANLTGAGVMSQHVEAGIILDTNQGDPQAVLGQVADAIDAWFIESRLGLYPVSIEADLDPLVAAGVLGVPAPTRPTRTVQPVKSGGQQARPAHKLKALVVPPTIQTPLTPASGTPSHAGGGLASATPPIPTPVGVLAQHWGKTLPASDAQRKPQGNQSGVVALTQGHYRRQIDQTTYFRQILFGQQAWQPATASTGQPMEIATVPMHTTVLGTYHGVLDYEVSDAPNRESNENNYTAKLHLEPVRALFSQIDMTGRTIEIGLDAQGDYWLTIS
jgi:hypothetical protein